MSSVYTSLVRKEYHAVLDEIQKDATGAECGKAQATRKQENEEMLYNLAIEEAQEALRLRQESISSVVARASIIVGDHQDEVDVCLDAWEKGAEASLTGQLRELGAANEEFETTVMMAEKWLRNLRGEQCLDGGMELKALEAMLDALWDPASKKNPCEIPIEIPVGIEIPWPAKALLPDCHEPECSDRKQQEARVKEVEATLEESAGSGDWFGAGQAAKELARARASLSQGEKPTVKKLQRGTPCQRLSSTHACLDLGLPYPVRKPNSLSGRLQGRPDQAGYGYRSP